MNRGYRCERAGRTLEEKGVLQQKEALQSRGENCRVEESAAEYRGKYSGLERNIAEKRGLQSRVEYRCVEKDT